MLDLKHVTPRYRTYAGADALTALPRELDRLGSKRALIVCGPSIRRQQIALDRVRGAVGHRLAGIFDTVKEHSPVHTVEDARNTLAEFQADSVVVVGGGSAIVTARAASIMLAEGGTIRDLCTYRDGSGRLVSPRLLQPKIPQLIVPSTPTTAYAKAGSAVRDTETGERLAMFDPRTRAEGLFIDPSIALTAPVSLVLSAGLNAYSMCIEGLQAAVDDPLGEALLAQGLRVLREWLPRVRSSPGDAEARMRVMLGTLLAGQGSDFTGGGLAQGLSHAIGPLSQHANGIAQAVLLPHVVRFNAAVTADRFERIANALGKSDGEPMAQTCTAIEQMLTGLGFPHRLRDLGIDKEILEKAVEQTPSDWVITQVPRHAGKDEQMAILEQAW
jgi:alcohol dehydrogenase class IV